MVVSALPKRTGDKLCYWLVLGFIKTSSRFRAVGLRNLDIAFPDKPKEEKKRILEDCIKMLGRHIGHFLRFNKYSEEDLKQCITYKDAPETERRIAERGENGAGTLFATMHFGFFEVLTQTQPLHVRPFNILARGFDLPKTDAWWNSFRTRNGNGMISRKGAFKQAEKLLSEGKDVAMLIDQNVKRNHAVFSDFFGMKAATTKTVALLAIRTGAPVVLGYIVELDDLQFEARYHLLDPPMEDGNIDERVLEFTNRMNAKIEEVIRIYPEHWFWIHRRFKTRPEGEAESVYAGC